MFTYIYPKVATPKDGPSADFSPYLALVSAFTKIAIGPDIAMTGETSLSGRAMRIGGLKEKLLAAHRGGVNSCLSTRQRSVICLKFQTRHEKEKLQD